MASRSQFLRIATFSFQQLCSNIPLTISFLFLFILLSLPGVHKRDNKVHGPDNLKRPTDQSQAPRNIQWGKLPNPTRLLPCLSKVHRNQHLTPREKDNTKTMNQIRAIQALNKREIENGVPPEASWHVDYRDTAYIYFGGLPFELSEGDVITIFSQFGEPVFLKLARDKETGKSKGFGWLKYEDQRSTDLAVDNLGGAEISGRLIRVDHARYKLRDDEDPEEGRIGWEDMLRRERAERGGGASEADSTDDEDEEEARKKTRPMLQEERELQLLIENHDDEDPMKQFLIDEKKKEVEEALRRESKKAEKHSHRHRHRHRDDDKHHRSSHRSRREGKDDDRSRDRDRERHREKDRGDRDSDSRKHRSRRDECPVDDERQEKRRRDSRDRHRDHRHKDDGGDEDRGGRGSHRRREDSRDGRDDRRHRGLKDRTRGDRRRSRSRSPRSRKD